MKLRVVQGLIDFLRGKKNFYSFCFPIYHFFKHKLGKSVIVLGNSHVNFFGINEHSADFQEAIHIDNFNVGINFCDRELFKFPKSKLSVFHLDPVLAYSLDKYNTKSLGREKVEYMIKNGYINKGSKILCCFGEIDIRSQLFKHLNKENTGRQTDLLLNDGINAILDNYLKFLLFLKNKGYKVYCWGVTPSGTFENAVDFQVFPEIEVNKAKKMFNNKLENICKEYGFGFINIFDKLINQDYTLKSEYTFDNFHLNNKIWTSAEKELLKSGIFDK